MIWDKKGKVVLWIIVIVLLLIIAGVGVYAYYTIYGFGSSGGNMGNGGGGPSLRQIISNISNEEAVNLFDRDFVLYLLYSIGAQGVHKVPFGSENPVIEIDVGGEVYNAEVVDGKIIVRDGGIDNEDIRIVSSKEEGIKMIRDQNYVVNSFREGKSSVEMVAGELELAGKGYLSLYNKLTGE
jgi:hypothetical protein